MMIPVSEDSTTLDLKKQFLFKNYRKCNSFPVALFWPKSNMRKTVDRNLLSSELFHN